MAKPFKINIKNEQLAGAIDLTGIKKKLAGKGKEPEKAKAKEPKNAPKAKVKEKETPSEEELELKAKEPPKVKARSRSVFAEPTKEKEVLPPEEAPIEEPEEAPEEILKEEPELTPEEEPVKTEESVEKKPDQEVPIQEKPLQEKPAKEKLAKEKPKTIPVLPTKEKLGPTGRHIRDLIPAKPKREPAAKPPAARPKTDTPSTTKEAPGAHKGKGPKARDFRDLKPTPRRVQPPGQFDARDRQGLRARDDDGGGQWRRRRASRSMKPKGEEIPVVRPTSLKIRLPLQIKDLASEMKLKASELISKLFLQGIVVTLNDVLDDETTVQLLGQDFGCEIEIDTTEEERIRITDQSIKDEINASNSDDLQQRPPVIAFMGHVDHGKTSLIDRIRKSSLVSQEAGAITQHIGAFTCQTPVGDITILDTPGHEAFTEMRARGADVTDIVVLVVAGDEGMKTQTQEAIQHAKAAGVTIIVAINKSDKPNFNTETVYRQLSEEELLPEPWGGQIITVNTSATTGEGIDQLLEMLALQSEVLELNANPKMRARGRVLESEMHKGLGAVTTVLVQNGTLSKGDALVFNTHYGRIRTMRDEFDTDLDKAGPSMAVEITGLSGLPKAGDEFIVVSSEKEAQNIAEVRQQELKSKLHATPMRNLESLFSEAKEGEKKVLNVILRADVQGSLEALKVALMKIESDKVDLNIIFSGVGEISESDVQLGAASKGVIIGFHNSIEQHAEQLVKELGVTVNLHDVIYHAIDDVKRLMTGQLDKLAQEEERGQATVLQTFKASQIGIIAGCMVNSGTISRNHKARLKRGHEVLFDGTLASLKRVKEDVKEVKKGFECGIVLNGFNDIQPEDIIETYEIIYIDQEL